MTLSRDISREEVDKPPLRVSMPLFSEPDIVEITARIGAVLRSGWLTSGSVVAEYERQFANIVGTAYAVALNSCTAALHCIMYLLGIGPGSEVVVPANTFASTANAVLYVGARPVFADCDSTTFNVTAETIEERIGPKTRAVLVVHIGGNPCDMDEIIPLCKKKNLFLIEDCAHALGSRYHNRQCGTFGAAGAFSFYPTKLITSGEGGMIATDLQRVGSDAKTFRNVGREYFGRTPITMLGYNYRMTDIHACVGINQLRRLDEFVARRGELAKIYDTQLRTIDWLKPQHIDNASTSSYYAYICRVSDGAPLSRDELSEVLKRESIETTVMFRPVYSHPYYRSQLSGVICPNAEMIGKESIVLPLHVGMRDEDVVRVVEVLRHVAPKR